MDTLKKMIALKTTPFASSSQASRQQTWRIRTALEALASRASSDNSGRSNSIQTFSSLATGLRQEDRKCGPRSPDTAVDRRWPIKPNQAYRFSKVFRVKRREGKAGLAGSIRATSSATIALPTRDGDGRKQMPLWLQPSQKQKRALLAKCPNLFCLAPRPGLEPGTYGLTVRRSTD